MRIVVCILTGAALAAHAIIGCGTDHACAHSEVSISAPDPCVRVHSCVIPPSESDSQGGSEDGSKDHGSRCHCSYVKADSPQIDFPSDAALLLDTTVASPVLTVSESQFGAAYEPSCGMNLLSTPLYVWHCALII